MFSSRVIDLLHIAWYNSKVITMCHAGGTMENFANEYLSLNKQWEETDKTTIAENVEKYINEQITDSSTWSARVQKIAEITDSKPDTVYAWLNRGRANVKVPFLKLCMIANYLKVDLKEFFIPSEM